MEVDQRKHGDSQNCQAVREIFRRETECGHTPVRGTCCPLTDILSSHRVGDVGKDAPKYDARRIRNNAWEARTGEEVHYGLAFTYTPSPL